MRSGDQDDDVEGKDVAGAGAGLVLVRAGAEDFELGHVRCETAPPALGRPFAVSQQAHSFNCSALGSQTPSNPAPNGIEVAHSLLIPIPSPGKGGGARVTNGGRSDLEGLISLPQRGVKGNLRYAPSCLGPLTTRA